MNSTRVAVSGIEIYKKPHSVGYSRSAGLREQIIDREHLRGKHRILPAVSNILAQIFPEEKHRSPVRKDKASSPYISFFKIVVGDLFQKRIHIIHLAAKITYPIAKTQHKQGIFRQKAIFSHNLYLFFEFLFKIIWKYRKFTYLCIGNRFE